MEAKTPSAFVPVNTTYHTSLAKTNVFLGIIILARCVTIPKLQRKSTSHMPKRGLDKSSPSGPLELEEN